MGRTAAERRAAELGASRKWTEEDAREALSALEASGESVNAFGRRLGIVPQRLLWWRSRLGRGRATPSFVPVEVTGTSPAVVVVAEDGTRVEVGTADAASAEWVATMLRSLRRRSR
jgi:transposase-like protein